MSNGDHCYTVVSFGIDDPVRASDLLTVVLSGEGRRRRRYSLRGPRAIEMARALQNRGTEPFETIISFISMARSFDLSVVEIH